MEIKGAKENFLANSLKLNGQLRMENNITTMITWRCKRALVIVYKARQKLLNQNW